MIFLRSQGSCLKETFLPLTGIDFSRVDSIILIRNSRLSTLNKIVNKHAPIKSLSKRMAKRQAKPWITEGIRTSIKLKNKFYASGYNVKYYRNKITSLIRISKKDYYHKFFNNNISNMRRTWEGINSLIHRKSKPSNSVHTLKDPNNNNQQPANNKSLSSY